MGAAPGGWTQVARERAASAKIIACDLLPMDPIAGVNFLRGDFRREITPTKIKDLLGSKEQIVFDIIMSDMAPNLSGNTLRDQALMLDLAQGILDKAEEFLDKVGGILLFKVFQGEDLPDILLELKDRGYNAKQVKPAASKDNSREVYIFAGME